MTTRDALGARMKEQYEHRARPMLPRRTWTVVRLDGRAFHSYTRGLDRPFDQQLMDDMAAVADVLCREVAGCRLRRDAEAEVERQRGAIERVRELCENPSAWGFTDGPSPEDVLEALDETS